MRPEAGRRKPVNPDAHGERSDYLALYVLVASAIVIVIASIIVGVFE
jgi:hypothetical protein